MPLTDMTTGKRYLTRREIQAEIDELSISNNEYAKPYEFDHALDNEEFDENADYENDDI